MIASLRSAAVFLGSVASDRSRVSSARSRSPPGIINSEATSSNCLSGGPPLAARALVRGASTTVVPSPVGNSLESSIAILSLQAETDVLFFSSRAELFLVKLFLKLTHVHILNLLVLPGEPFM
jgi:hypothetical protein